MRDTGYTQGYFHREKDDNPLILGFSLNMFSQISIKTVFFVGKSLSQRLNVWRGEGPSVGCQPATVRVFLLLNAISFLIPYLRFQWAIHWQLFIAMNWPSIQPKVVIFNNLIIYSYFPLIYIYISSTIMAKPLTINNPHLGTKTISAAAFFAKPGVREDHCSPRRCAAPCTLVRTWSVDCCHFSAQPQDE